MLDLRTENENRWPLAEPAASTKSRRVVELGGYSEGLVGPHGRYSIENLKVLHYSRQAGFHTSTSASYAFAAACQGLDNRGVKSKHSPHSTRTFPSLRRQDALELRKLIAVEFSHALNDFTAQFCAIFAYITSRSAWFQVWVSAVDTVSHWFPFIAQAGPGHGLSVRARIKMRPATSLKVIVPHGYRP